MNKQTTSEKLPKVLEDIAIAFGLDEKNIVMNRIHEGRIASVDGVEIRYDQFGRIKEVGGKHVLYKFGDEAQGAKQVGDKPIVHTGLGVKAGQYDRSYFSKDGQ